MNLKKAQQTIEGAISTFDYLIANEKSALQAALQKNEARAEESMKAIEAMHAMVAERVKEFFRELSDDLQRDSRVLVEELERARGDEPRTATIPDVNLEQDDNPPSEREE